MRNRCVEIFLPDETLDNISKCILSSTILGSQLSTALMPIYSKRPYCNIIEMSKCFKELLLNGFTLKESLEHLNGIGKEDTSVESFNPPKSAKFQAVQCLSLSSDPFVILPMTQISILKDCIQDPDIIILYFLLFSTKEDLSFRVDLLKEYASVSTLSTLTEGFQLESLPLEKRAFLPFVKDEISDNLNKGSINIYSKLSLSKIKDLAFSTNLKSRENAFVCSVAMKWEELTSTSPPPPLRQLVNDIVFAETDNITLGNFQEKIKDLKILQDHISRDYNILIRHDEDKNFAILHQAMSICNSLTSDMDYSFLNEHVEKLKMMVGLLMFRIGSQVSTIDIADKMRINLDQLEERSTQLKFTMNAADICNCLDHFYPQSGLCSRYMVLNTDYFEITEVDDSDAHQLLLSNNKIRLDHKLMNIFAFDFADKYFSLGDQKAYESLSIALNQDFSSLQHLSLSPKKCLSSMNELPHYFNVFKSSSVSEFLKVKKTTLDLLDNFPENPLLTDILTVVERILGFPARSPISKFQEDIIIFDWQKLELSNVEMEFSQILKNFGENSYEEMWRVFKSLNLGSAVVSKRKFMLACFRFLCTSNIGEFERRLVLSESLIKLFDPLCKELADGFDIILKYFQRCVPCINKVIHDKIKELTKSVKLALKSEFISYRKYRSASKKTTYKKIVADFIEFLRESSFKYFRINSPFDKIDISSQSLPKFEPKYHTIADIKNECEHLEFFSSSEASLGDVKSLNLKSNRLLNDLLISNNISNAFFSENLKEIIISYKDIPHKALIDDPKGFHKYSKLITEVLRTMKDIGISYKLGLIHDVGYINFATTQVRNYPEHLLQILMRFEELKEMFLNKSSKKKQLNSGVIQRIEGSVTHGVLYSSSMNSYCHSFDLVQKDLKDIITKLIGSNDGLENWFRWADKSKIALSDSSIENTRRILESLIAQSTVMKKDRVEAEKARKIILAFESQIKNIEGIRSKDDLSNKLLKLKEVSEKFNFPLMSTYLSILESSKIRCHNVALIFDEYLRSTLEVFIQFGDAEFKHQPEEEEDDQQNEGEDKGPKEGCGLGDGTGNDNVSSEIPNEDMLEGAERKEDQEDEKEDKDEEDQKGPEEDDGIEMQDDFDDGKFESKEEDEDREEDDDKDEEEELDKKEEDVDENVELDDDLWKDEDDEEPEDESKEDEKISEEKKDKSEKSRKNKEHKENSHSNDKEEENPDSEADENESDFEEKDNNELDKDDDSIDEEDKRKREDEEFSDGEELDLDVVDENKLDEHEPEDLNMDDMNIDDENEEDIMDMDKDDLDDYEKPDFEDPDVELDDDKTDEAGGDNSENDPRENTSNIPDGTKNETVEEDAAVNNQDSIDGTSVDAKSTESKPENKSVEHQEKSKANEKSKTANDKEVVSNLEIAHSNEEESQREEESKIYDNLPEEEEREEDPNVVETMDHKQLKDHSGKDKEEEDEKMDVDDSVNTIPKIESDKLPTLGAERPNESYFSSGLNMQPEINADIDFKSLTNTKNPGSSNVSHENIKEWTHVCNGTSSLSQNLMTKLRLLFEPTKANRLKGDYKSGKRLNMRKIIPYIASHFRKDKIWFKENKSV
ncbi:MDN1 [Lepeophtheirus salmonis]|uniref:MDN1 n=1 Tax=Lepeophtheirus salmonis TaxID=72036 RepID=A0A7R8H976_LEPSM|nr:MDN1 [Lepeophtheirus salmonis]CAF2952033.1 MDN1 [Lepeophtheirus salmonis]